MVQTILRGAGNKKKQKERVFQKADFIPVASGNISGINLLE